MADLETARQIALSQPEAEGLIILADPHSG